MPTAVLAGVDIDGKLARLLFSLKDRETEGADGCGFFGSGFGGFEGYSVKRKRAELLVLAHCLSIRFYKVLVVGSSTG